MEKSLKEIMVDEIKGYEWLDYSAKRNDCNRQDFKDYESWLRSLSDSDFLWRYNDVREAINGLD